MSPPQSLPPSAEWVRTTRYEYLIDKSLILPHKPGVDCLSDLHVINKETKSKICLRPGDGQFVVVGSRRFHLLLTTWFNRKFWVWIRDPLTEDVYITQARQVDTMDPAPTLSKIKLESTRISVAISAFISCHLLLCRYFRRCFRSRKTLPNWWYQSRTGPRSGRRPRSGHLVKERQGKCRRRSSATV